MMHICCPRMDVLATAVDFRETRWCFGCRKHLRHEWAMHGDPKPSYYDPLPSCRCSACGQDRTDFNGWRDGPHYPEQRVEWSVL